ncbi:hypothetical protein [Streptosporangium sp. NPDC000509]|uniref:hypothetical protein n=1 Tax=Streptosporangium sp. NPDC000509 TaxID=3366186 RepID=UPI003693705B
MRYVMTGSPPNSLDMSRAARLARHGSVSTALALFSDRRLAELVETAPHRGTGVGGTTALLEIEGKPVFVKRVPLTDLERRPKNIGSTANVFKLPAFCHYGLGSGSGFGAWRELAAHVMATGWVVGGRYEGFRCCTTGEYWRSRSARRRPESGRSWRRPRRTGSRPRQCARD